MNPADERVMSVRNLCPGDKSVFRMAESCSIFKHNRISMWQRTICLFNAQREIGGMTIWLTSQ